MSDSQQPRQVRETLREFILKEFLPGVDAQELTDQTPLITGGIVDSISTLKLVSFLEETWGIQLEAHEVDADHLDSVDLIASLVEARA